MPSLTSSAGTIHMQHRHTPGHRSRAAGRGRQRRARARGEIKVGPRNALQQQAGAVHDGELCRQSRQTTGMIIRRLDEPARFAPAANREPVARRTRKRCRRRNKQGFRRQAASMAD